MVGTSLKSKVFSGLLWKCSGTIGLKVIRFFISIVLARLLAPEDFGVIAIVAFFISLGEVFIDSGFNDAIIQKKDLTLEDCNSVYWFNIFLACCIYIVFFILAPFVSRFYHTDRLKSIFRVIALSPIIGSISLVPRSLLLKRMEFKKNAAILWCSLLAGGSIAIIGAFLGLGAWALVLEFLTGNIVKCTLCLIAIKWRLSFSFEFNRVVQLFQFGWKMLLRNLLYITQTNLNTLFFGRIGSLEQTAYYARGHAYPNLLSTTLDGAFDEVLFSAMSSVQDAPERLSTLRYRGFQISTFASFPALFLLAFVAPEVISFMLTDKWLPCVPFLRIVCIEAFLLNSLCILRQSFNSIGRSDIPLKIQIYLFSCNFIVLIGCTIFNHFCTIRKLTLAEIVLTAVILNYTVLIPLFHYSKKLFFYTFFQYIKDIGHNFIGGLLTLIICLCLWEYLHLNSLLFTLILKSVNFFVIYILFSILSHAPAVIFLQQEIKIKYKHH